MGAQAQSLLQTIKTIKEEKRSEQAAFEKQIDAVLSTYNRKKSISENDANKYLSDQSDEINTAAQAKLNGTYIPKDTNGSVDFELPDNPSVDFEIPGSASTGKDLRAERLQKIAEGRDWTVQEKEEQLRHTQTMIKASNQNIQTINKKYDDELRSLEKESSILDSNGRSVKIAPSAEEVTAVEKRRQDNLKDETKMLADFKALENKHLTAESKQQSSQAKAEQFSLNLNTASASERFAAKRKAKLAEGTAVAQQNMASNGRGSEASSSSSAPERPTPPSAPSGAARPTPQSPANDPRVAQAA